MTNTIQLHSPASIDTHENMFGQSIQTQTVSSPGEVELLTQMSSVLDNLNVLYSALNRLNHAIEQNLTVDHHHKESDE